MYPRPKQKYHGVYQTICVFIFPNLLLVVIQNIYIIFFYFFYQSFMPKSTSFIAPEILFFSRFPEHYRVFYVFNLENADEKHKYQTKKVLISRKKCCFRHHFYHMCDILQPVGFLNVSRFEFQKNYDIFKKYHV